MQSTASWVKTLEPDVTDVFLTLKLFM
jgi:hypothetical protein